MSRIPVVVSALLALLVVGTARAQDVAGEPEAVESEESPRALFLQGVEYADQERWGEAVEYFRRSWALSPRASTAFNLAGALLRLGRPVQALDALQDFMRISDEPSDAERRAAARDMMEVALAAVARLELTLTPPQATVRIDGEPAGGDGSRRQLHIDPGEHTLRIEAEGYLPQVLAISLLDGERVSRTVTLEPGASGPARLRITSDRADAHILIDEQEVGRGTFMDDLEPGPHVIEVRAEGFEAFRRALELRPGEELDVQASLSAVTSTELWEDPVFWVVVGIIAAAGAGAAIGIAVASGPAAPYRGSTNVVLQGLVIEF